MVKIWPGVPLSLFFWVTLKISPPEKKSTMRIINPTPPFKHFSKIHSGYDPKIIMDPNHNHYGQSWVQSNETIWVEIFRQTDNVITIPGGTSSIRVKIISCLSSISFLFPFSIYLTFFFFQKSILDMIQDHNKDPKHNHYGQSWWVQSMNKNFNLGKISIFHLGKMFLYMRRSSWRHGMIAQPHNIYPPYNARK